MGMPEADGRTVAETTDGETNTLWKTASVFPTGHTSYGFICLFVLLLSLLCLGEICRSMFLIYVCVYVLCVYVHMCAGAYRICKKLVNLEWPVAVRLLKWTLGVPLKEQYSSLISIAVIKYSYQKQLGEEMVFISLPGHNPSLRAVRAGTRQ